MANNMKKLSSIGKISLIAKLILALSSLTFMVLSISDVVDFEFASYFIYIPILIVTVSNVIESYKNKKQN